MAQYEPPTEQLAIFDPSVFTTNDEPLTINTGSKYFLKYPNAQGTENFVDMNVYGNAKVDGAITATNNLTISPTNGVSITRNLTMINASSANRIIKCGELDLDDNAGAGSARFRMFTSGIDNYYRSLPNSNLSTINFQLNNSSATTITPLQLTPLAANANVALVANQGLTVNNQPSTFNAGLNVYADSVFDGSLNMAVNSTITMNAGSVINMNGQNITNLNNVSSVNNQSLKVEGSGTGTVVLRTGNNDRLTVSSAGVVTVPNQVVTPTVTSASTLSVTASGGSSILNLNGEGGIQISTGTIQRIGIASGGTTTFFNPIIMAANQSITQSGSVFNTLGGTTMVAGNNLAFPSGNGVITQVVTNPTDKNLLKKTSMSINSGSGAAGYGGEALEIYDVATGADNRGFLFLPNSGSGSFNTFARANDCLVLSKNSGAGSGSPNSALTLTAWTTNRIGIRLNATTAGAPTIEMATLTNTTLMDKDRTAFASKATFRAGLYSGTVIGYATSGNTETDLMTLSSTQTQFDLPVAFGNTQYSTAKTATQLGYITNGLITNVDKSSSASIQYLGDVSGTILLNQGSWRIDVNFAFTPASPPATFSVVQLGISGTNSAFGTGSLATSTYIREPFTISDASYFKIGLSASLLVSAASTPVYPVFILQFTSGGDVTIGCTYTLTRIG